MIDSTEWGVRVRFRVGEDDTESVVPWREARTELLFAARPWRTFRWHHGQKHYSGFYWACTEQDLVIYESRLEPARLLLADFDPSVRRILAQPFLLAAEIKGRPHRHVPDYLLLLDVAPWWSTSSRRCDCPSLRSPSPSTGRERWSNRATGGTRSPRNRPSRNWRTCGSSRDTDGTPCSTATLLEELRSLDLTDRSVAEAFACLPDRPAPAVPHLRWRQHWTVDLAEAVYCEDALAVCRAAGFADGEGEVLNSLAHIAHQAGRSDDALAHIEQAIAIRRQVGNAFGEATDLDEKGRIRAAMGRAEHARQAWQQALERYEKLGRTHRVQQVRRRLDGLT